MNYIDTHYHLDLAPKPEEVKNKIEEMGIHTIAVTNTPSVFNYTANLVKGSKYISAALGIHPELAVERKNEIQLFKELATQTRYIGEVGIDGNIRDDIAKTTQNKIFQTVLDCCALIGGKVISVHSRKASREVISMIGNNYPCKIILHWFSGSIKDLETAISYDYYFSVNHSMLSSKNGQRILQHIPIEKLLTESDGPFTSSNGVPSTPLVVKETTQLIADYHKTNIQIITDQLYRNYQILTA